MGLESQRRRRRQRPDDPASQVRVTRRARALPRDGPGCWPTRVDGGRSSVLPQLAAAHPAGRIGCRSRLESAEPSWHHTHRSVFSKKRPCSCCEKVTSAIDGGCLSAGVLEVSAAALRMGFRHMVAAGLYARRVGRRRQQHLGTMPGTGGKHVDAVKGKRCMELFQPAGRAIHGTNSTL